jgi:hypothetical protein
LSRFRIVVLLTAFSALAIAFAACGGSSSSDDPQSVIDNATLEGVQSGNIDLSLAIDAKGEEGGKVDVALSGPFQSRGSDNLPELDLIASAKGKAEGEDVDFEGGLTLLPDRGYVNYEGIEYEVDPTTFGFVKSGFEQAQEEGGSEGNPADVTACQEAASGIEIGDFVDNLSDEGSADVDGTGTTKVSGDLDVGSAIDTLIKLAEDPACATQLEAAGPLPIGELEKAKGEVTSAVKKAHVEIYVGDDDIVRKLVAELTVAPKDESGTVEADLELTLSGVNEEQTISAPDKAKPLQVLFQKLDVNPIELLEAGSSGEGIGDLLESVIEGQTDGSSSGGSSSGGSSGGNQQAYLECLKDAQSPPDLQHCASLIR